MFIDSYHKPGSQSQEDQLDKQMFKSRQESFEKEGMKQSTKAMNNNNQRIISKHK